MFSSVSQLRHPTQETETVFPSKPQTLLKFCLMIPHSEKTQFRLSAAWSWQPAMLQSVPQCECLMSPWLDAGDTSSDTSFPHCEPPSDSVPLSTSFTLTSGFRLLLRETSPLPFVINLPCRSLSLAVPAICSSIYIWRVRQFPILFKVLVTYYNLYSFWRSNCPLWPMESLSSWCFGPFGPHHSVSTSCFYHKKTCTPSCTLPGTALKSAIFQRRLAHLGGKFTDAGSSSRQLAAPRSSSDTQTRVLWGQWFRIGFLLRWPNMCEVTLALLLGWNILNCFPRKMSATVKCHCILDWGKNH